MPPVVTGATLQIPHVSIFPHEKSGAPATDGYQHGNPHDTHRQSNAPVTDGHQHGCMSGNRRNEGPFLAIFVSPKREIWTGRARKAAILATR